MVDNNFLKIVENDGKLTISLDPYCEKCGLKSLTSQKIESDTVRYTCTNCGMVKDIRTGDLFDELTAYKNKCINNNNNNEGPPSKTRRQRNIKGKSKTEHTSTF